MIRAFKIFSSLFLIAVMLGMAGAGAALYGFWYFGRDLPDYQQLAGYEPPVMTRVHAADGSLINEYARQRRLFVPINAIPKRVVHAFISAEDKNFYSHYGVDFPSVMRAVIVNIQNIGRSRRPVGASTITQQVAKNMLLTNEVSLERKAKEAILAFRIERSLSKERILELYLNEIYLGFASYGVAAAALNYFDKSLDQLNLAEVAYLAALPKAPSNYHPIRRNQQAVIRRNWVIDRMVEEGYASRDEAAWAKKLPLEVRRGRDAEFFRADWFVEEVRRQLYERYGEDDLYEGGLSVRTTMDPRLQAIGEKVLRQGLVAYDRRHGWRGPLGNLKSLAGWREALEKFKQPPGIAPWSVAVVLDLSEDAAEIGFASGDRGMIPLSKMKWARAWLKDETLGPKVERADEVLSPGDMVAVSKVEGEGIGDGVYALEQIPRIDGGLVAMDPHTGRVLAIVGGWSYDASQFNRATQAQRQPGSAFKPFVYAAALDHGFTPSSLVLDAPFVLEQADGSKWKPSNYSRKFYGPSTLRLGIEKSRNLMTVRLARYIGMEVVSDYAQRFGITDNLPGVLSMSLGAGETTLLRLTTAYAELVNGGKRITPTLIDRVQDRRGKTLYRHDERLCASCNAASWHGQPEPEIPEMRPEVVDPGTAYQVVSMLQGVVQRGTGRRVSAVGKPLAGKTGTTNKSFDTWFMGFSPDLAVGVYMGFDTPRSLGKRETGSSVAVPVFRDFMAEALEGKPSIPFRVPPGIRLVRVNAKTGLPAKRGDRNVILEAFKAGTEPGSEQVVLDGSDVNGATRPGAPVPASVNSGTGGLY